MCGEICTNVDNSLSHKLFGTLHASEGFGGGMGQFVPFAVLSPAKRLGADRADELCVALRAWLVFHGEQNNRLNKLRGAVRVRTEESECVAGRSKRIM
jgi:hypothetical protein